MSDMLAAIYRDRRRRLQAEMALEPLAALEVRAEARRGDLRSLAAALVDARPPALIAEIKRASPSAGLIAADFDPAEIAARYQLGGADAISVLTEIDHFQGDLRHVEAARSRTSLPLLRKDFLSTPYEVVQSLAYGADAILAIVAGVTDPELEALLETARQWGLDVLVEVHTAEEVTRALGLGASLLGINNRDLRTLRTDTGITDSLLGLLPPGLQLVSESGFESAEQIHRSYRGGVHAFLVGEALMRAPDKVAWIGAVKALGAVEAPP